MNKNTILAHKVCMEILNLKVINLDRCFKKFMLNPFNRYKLAVGQEYYTTFTYGKQLPIGSVVVRFYYFTSFIGYCLCISYIIEVVCQIFIAVKYISPSPKLLP